MQADTIPAGFSRSLASGLILPEPIARPREVWTRDEWRLLERAMTLLESHKVDVFFGCRERACQGQPITRSRTPDGGLLLRCAHLDRVLTKAF